MARESIQYVMAQRALKDITNKNTIRAYKYDVKEFATWARSKGYRRIEDIVAGDARTVVQEYRDSVLLPRGFSPQTEHRKVSAVCKGLGITRPRGKDQPGWAGRIVTTIRSAGSITKGRNSSANLQGKKEMALKKNERLVRFQEAVGIRRAELGRLRGRDLVRDESGHLCVRVERGKGGKEQLQRILPQDEMKIIKYFDDIAPDDKIFSPKELHNHIDLHSLRARQAQKAYAYYKDKLKTREDREALARELIARFERYHTDKQGVNKFKTEISKGVAGEEYRIRGDNRKKAVTLGLPVTYDRLALMATSVFFLSHWRADVTITNYLIR